tara:strand:+ start:714 stop:974 length:261 start_codon:yes stop_codon:yes gene_type:complete
MKYILFILLCIILIHLFFSYREGLNIGNIRKIGTKSRIPDISPIKQNSISEFNSIMKDVNKYSTDMSIMKNILTSNFYAKPPILVK